MVGTLRCKPVQSLRADSGSRMLRIRDQDVAAAIVRHDKTCGTVAAQERDIRRIDAVGHAERAASIERVWRISERGVGAERDVREIETIAGRKPRDFPCELYRVIKPQHSGAAQLEAHTASRRAEQLDLGGAADRHKPVTRARQSGGIGVDAKAEAGAGPGQIGNVAGNIRD